MNKYSTDNENVKGKRMSDEKTVKLSDICILEKGQQIDTSLLDDTKPYRYINGGIKESGYYDDFNTSGESVLISEGGASCGYINYVNENFWCGCHCYRLHDIKVFPKYLFHALKANQQRIMALRTGSAMPNIQKSTIQKFELKIHDDINTQKKVSSMLDKCNELIEKHKLTLEKYDSLIKSRFIEMFGDPVTNPKKWEFRKLSELAEYWNGLTYKPENVNENGTIVLRSSNIQDSTLYFDDIVRVDCKIKEKHFVKDNDILMCSRNGSAKLVGKVALIKNLKEDTSFGAFMMIIRSNYYQYLFTYFQTEAFRRQIKTGATTTVNQITNNMLNQISIPLPPKELQNEFASFVQQIDKSKFETNFKEKIA